MAKLIEFELDEGTLTSFGRLFETKNATPRRREEKKATTDDTAWDAMRGAAIFSVDFHSCF